MIIPFANKCASCKAMTVRLTIEDQWRQVAGLERSATLRDTNILRHV
jgi:hypothetical protein